MNIIEQYPELHKCIKETWLLYINEDKPKNVEELGSKTETLNNAILDIIEEEFENMCYINNWTIPEDEPQVMEIEDECGTKCAICNCDVLNGKELCYACWKENSKKRF